MEIAGVKRFLPHRIVARAVALHMRMWRTIHCEATLRHAVEGFLLLAIAVVGWQLVRPWLPIKPLPEASTQPPLARSSTQWHDQSNAVIRDHLFGVPVSTSNVIPVAVTPTFVVSGILYASAANQSVAILTSNGQNFIGHIGSQLPDGEKIIAIEQQRVLVNHNGRIENVLLAIKKADINAHFSPAQFAGGGYTSIINPADASDTSANTKQASPADTNATQTIPITDQPKLVTPHFESLKQLRGAHTMNRFRKVRPPASYN